MKRLFTFSYISILIGIVFSSCSSNTSIVKRRYTKGYYVEWNKNKPNVFIGKQDSKIVQARIKTPLHSLLLKENNISEHFKSNIPTNYIIEVADNSIFNKEISEPGVKQTLNRNIYISESPAFEKMQPLFQANEYYHDDSERTALSLLWIVIIVVLILWLIGILAGGWGLGGLINLLLIIALILLILWLLRIV